MSRRKQSKPRHVDNDSLELAETGDLNPGPQKQVENERMIGSYMKENNNVGEGDMEDGEFSDHVSHNDDLGEAASPETEDLHACEKCGICFTELNQYISHRKLCGNRNRLLMPYDPPVNGLSQNGYNSPEGDGEEQKQIRASLNRRLREDSKDRRGRVRSDEESEEFDGEMKSSKLQNGDDRDLDLDKSEEYEGDQKTGRDEQLEDEGDSRYRSQIRSDESFILGLRNRMVNSLQSFRDKSNLDNDVSDFMNGDRRRSRSTDDVIFDEMPEDRTKRRKLSDGSTDGKIKDANIDEDEIDEDKKSPTSTKDDPAVEWALKAAERGLFGALPQGNVTLEPLAATSAAVAQLGDRASRGAVPEEVNMFRNMLFQLQQQQMMQIQMIQQMRRQLIASGVSPSMLPADLDLNMMSSEGLASVGAVMSGLQSATAAAAAAAGVSTGSSDAITTSSSNYDSQSILSTASLYSRFNGNSRSPLPASGGKSPPASPSDARIRRPSTPSSSSPSDQAQRDLSSKDASSNSERHSSNNTGSSNLDKRKDYPADIADKYLLLPPLPLNGQDPNMPPSSSPSSQSLPRNPLEILQEKTAASMSSMPLPLGMRTSDVKSSSSSLLSSSALFASSPSLSALQKETDALKPSPILPPISLPMTPEDYKGYLQRGTILERSQYASDDPFFKHKCRFCHKVFGSDSALQIHVRSHTGERPFKCNICGNRFSTKGNLKVHFERHKAKYPHVKMDATPVPEHLDRHPHLLAGFPPTPIPPSVPLPPPMPRLPLPPTSHGLPPPPRPPPPHPSSQILHPASSSSGLIPHSPSMPSPFHPSLLPPSMSPFGLMPPPPRDGPLSFPPGHPLSLTQSTSSPMMFNPSPRDLILARRDSSPSYTPRHGPSTSGEATSVIRSSAIERHTPPSGSRSSSPSSDHIRSYHSEHASPLQSQLHSQGSEHKEEGYHSSENSTCEENHRSRSLERRSEDDRVRRDSRSGERRNIEDLQRDERNERREAEEERESRRDRKEDFEDRNEDRFEDQRREDLRRERDDSPRGSSGRRSRSRSPSPARRSTPGTRGTPTGPLHLPYSGSPGHVSTPSPLNSPASVISWASFNPSQAQLLPGHHPTLLPPHHPLPPGFPGLGLPFPAPPTSFPLPSPLNPVLPMSGPRISSPFLPPPPPPPQMSTPTSESSVFRNSILPTKTIDPSENLEQYMEIQKSETSKLEALVKNIEDKITDPNQCVVCHRVLSCKSALQMHYRIHTGERPFKCKICGRSFTTKGNLKTHMGVHRAKPALRMMHQCPVCHKQFTNVLVLQQHIRAHTGTMHPMPHLPMLHSPLDWPHHRPFHPNRHHPYLPPSLHPDLQKQSPFSEMLYRGERSHNVDHDSRKSDSTSPKEQKFFDKDERENLKSDANLGSDEDIERAASDSGNQLSSKKKETEESDRSASALIDVKREISPSVQTSKAEFDSAFLPPSFGNSTFGAPLAALEERVKAIDSQSAQSAFEKFRNSMGLDSSYFPHLTGNSGGDQDSESDVKPSPTDLSAYGFPMAPGFETAGTTTCNICLKTFACRSALEIHYRSHSKEKPFHCELCPKSFSTKGNMKQHMLTHNTRDDINEGDDGAKKENGEDNENDEIENEEDELPNEDYQDEEDAQYDYDLSQDYDDDDEERFDEEDQDNIESLEMDGSPSADFEASKNGDDDDTSEPNCETTSEKKETDEERNQDETLPDDASRDETNYKTQDQSSSKPTSSCQSEKITPSTTAETATPKQSSNSSSHHSSNQSARKPNGPKHQCMTCMKPFSSASALQIHMRTHTGDKPFKCTVCSKAFTTRGNLKVHMGTHMWNNSPSRRGRRMSIEPPFLLSHMKDNPFMPAGLPPRPHPDFFYQYPSHMMNGLSNKMNEISVIQSLGGSMPGFPPLPPHLMQGFLPKDSSKLVPNSDKHPSRSGSDSEGSRRQLFGPDSKKSPYSSNPIGELDLSVKPPTSPTQRDNTTPSSDSHSPSPSLSVRAPNVTTASPSTPSPSNNKENSNASALALDLRSLARGPAAPWLWGAFQCDQCNQVLPTQEALEHHNRTQHMGKTSESVTPHSLPKAEAQPHQPAKALLA